MESNIHLGMLPVSQLTATYGRNHQSQSFTIAQLSISMLKNALQYSVSCHSNGDLRSQQSDAVDAWLMSESNPHDYLDISQTFTTLQPQ